MNLFYRLAGWHLRFTLALRYRVRTTYLNSAREAIVDTSAGRLVIFNHPTWGIEASKIFSDLAIVGGKPVIVVAESQLENPMLGGISKLFECVVIPDMTVKGSDAATLERANRTINDALRDKKLVVIAGAGRIYRSRFETMGSMVGNILANPETSRGVRTITAYSDGLWGSRFSFAGFGEYPSIGRNIKLAVLAFVGNLGFIPKHPWSLTFSEQKESVRGKTAVEINEYFKGLFNTTERGPNHPRMGIRYRLGWWDATVPVPDPTISQMGGDIDRVPDDVRHATVAKIVEITKDKGLADYPVDSPDLLSKHLRDDVGMDSLATADLLLWVEEYTLKNTGTKFQVENTETILTVRDAILAAAGQAKVEGGARIALPSARWLLPPTEKKIEYEWDGVPFPIAWLKKVAHAPREVILADPNFGSPTQRKLLQILLAILPTIKSLPGERVGLLLPSGTAAFVAVQAIRLAGKVPVLLNHTTGLEATLHAVRITGIKHVVTSSLVLSKIEWGDKEKRFLGIEWVEFEKVKASLKLGDKLRILFGSLLCSTSHLVPKEMPKEAAILVTSGSEGLPKAVAITDEMIGVFVGELLRYFDMREGDRLLQTGPPFHVLGFLAGIVFPSVIPLKLGLVPNPIDYKGLATVAELFQLNLTVSPPAFAEGMVAASLPGQLDSLDLLVYGAQAMSPAQRKSILARAPQLNIREGYGLTEATGGLAFEHRSGGEKGWFEILRPVDFKLVDHETGEVTTAPGKMGILHVRGPTVITSYLKSEDPALDTPSTAFVKIGDATYFKTGDLVRSHPKTPRYFQYVTRVSRTYKDKAGEFINPDLIQDALNAAFPRREEDVKGPIFAVTGAKQVGHTQSVLFTTRKLTLEEANHGIFAQGLSPVLRLYKVYQVHAIPLAGSGKVSLSTIERWANALENPEPYAQDLQTALVSTS